MKITRVHIRNFRSIKSLDFEPNNVCALVGENGAGKSNILAALDFLMGERWPSSRNLGTSDYFGHDEMRQIVIGVTFEQNSSGVEKYWCKFTFGEKDEVRVKYTGKPNPEYVSNELREQLALVYVDANRDVDKHLSQSRWLLFGRILRRFDSVLPDSNKEKLEFHFRETLTWLQTEQFNAFESEMRSAFTDQIRHINKSLQIEFKNFDPLSYYKSINLLLQEDDRSIPITHAGQGVRNMAILALFRAYAKVFKDDGILGIEEPELYLHPHAERTLAKLFRDLSNQGNQLFYTTHSSRFIDIEHFDEICLVEKKIDDEGDLCTCLRKVSSQKLLDQRKKLFPSIEFTVEGIRQRYRNLCALEHSEGFFARKIILVEGETEECTLPIYASAMGYDLDVHGVSVINAYGKTNLDQLYQLYQAFNIPIYLIFDNDRKFEDENSSVKYNEVLLGMLNEPKERKPAGKVTNHYAISDINFENEILSAIGQEQYNILLDNIKRNLGRVGKSIEARFIASELVEQQKIPAYIQNILANVQWLGTTAANNTTNEIPF